jgi:hypothetical protein
MSDDTTEQFRFSDDGELEKPDDEEKEEQLVDDWGNERPWYLTKGRFRRDIVTSPMQKGVRRNCEEKTAWAAWELARSGLIKYVFERLNLFVIEDLRAGHEVALLIQRYEELATDRWDPDSWRGRLCIIHAALAAARAPSSRESTYANGAFDSIAKDRVRADQDDDHERVFGPVVSEEELNPDGKLGFVVADKHTYPGAGAGRDWAHFRIHGSRRGPDSDTEVGKKWREQVLTAEKFGYREDQIEFTEEEIAHALEPTDATDPWRCDLRENGDAELDEFDTEEE